MQIKQITVYEIVVAYKLTNEEILEMIDNGDIIFDGCPVSSEWEIVG